MKYLAKFWVSDTRSYELEIELPQIAYNINDLVNHPQVKREIEHKKFESSSVIKIEFFSKLEYVWERDNGES